MALMDKRQTFGYIWKNILMQKIIAAFDGLRFSEATLQQAIGLAKKHGAHLVGVFLQENNNRDYTLYETLVLQSGTGRALIGELEKHDESTWQESVESFEYACQEAGLTHSIHRDRGTALKELLHETVFADLLLIAPGETFSSIEQKEPSWFIKSLLHQAHCPVWLVPAKSHPVNRVLFLYDASPSSVYAMKMYTYLFPGKNGPEPTLVSIKPGIDNLHLPDNKLVHEWIKRHYPAATFKVVKGDVSELVAQVKEMGPETLLVSGAYERSRFSMWVYPSLADELVRQLKTPLFIAHD